MQNMSNHQYNLIWCYFQCKICETNAIECDVAFNAKYVKPIQSCVMELSMQNLWNQYNLMCCKFQCKICETNTILCNGTFNTNFVKPIQFYMM